jgi:ABC-type dipeptide/oligopeptide/nickel transport system ATPase subunit
MHNRNWSRHRPTKPSELIGESVRFIHESISFETQQEDGERCFLLHGRSGRGKTTIATFIGKEYADHEDNVITYKGNDVTLSEAKDIMYRCQLVPFNGRRRALIINEVDNINKDVQNVLHDWLQDELPNEMVVLVTTNKKPSRDEEWETMSESERKDHLTPKFGSRFTWHETPTLNTKEIADELVRMCGIPPKAATVCANNGKGDYRHTFKEVQKAITSAKIRKQKEKLQHVN